jgi:hypothetical protein
MASERDYKDFYENQSIRGLFGFESSFWKMKFLESQVCFKSVKYEMFDRTQQPEKQFYC